ncbi:MAG: radical SAM family heme chaperone HemW [Planctomycetota bacterium]|nr:radical SAM family heme chaperone HemW [Planctomycetota bacterium]
MAERGLSLAPTSVYVHVPFCVVKCGYCDFNSYPTEGTSELDRFLDGLHTELNLVPLPKTAISVFIGGGTPTYLDEARLRRLFAITGRRLNLRGCDEVTMEANPESVTLDKARLALDAGVNRVSIGAQSFHADHLAFLDRAHSADDTARAFETFREAGFTNLSLDLMFSIPGQTIEQWEADLRRALSYDPDHLSCYNLTYEPGTRLTRDLEQGRVSKNPDEIDREMFLLTRQILAEAGFEAYETSNFAGRGGKSRHNDHYWLQGDYVGVGPGASDHRQGVRSTNLKPIHAWAESLERGMRPTASAETLTAQQRAGEALWLGLRRKNGICLERLSQRLGISVQEHWSARFRALGTQGLLQIEGTQVSLTGEGQLFGNSVGEEFLAG